MKLFLLSCFFCICSLPLFAQSIDYEIKTDSTLLKIADDTIKRNNPKLYDIVDLFKDIKPFKKSKTDSLQKKRSTISYLPNLNYNPSIGFQVGIKAVGGVYLGDKKNTSMSVFATAANYTTRGIMVGYLFHDLFTEGNKWNLKGSIHVAKMVGLDYGLGIGNIIQTNNPEIEIMNNPDRIRYTNQFTVYGFSERVYKRLFPGMFVGAGVYFDLKRNITTLNDVPNPPNTIYSNWNNYDQEHNNTNGLMLNVQYMNRDNPNNAYKGIYTDVVLRANQNWMGSSQSALQLITDYRQYFPLSKARPNHVLAFWYYGSYNLSGNLPYLDLPGTGKDPHSRTGRGYTNGYFKGESYVYTELEYRFPILRNQFLSGVVFGNLQTVSDQMGTKLFKYWQPAGGAGLRVLFNKMTRTNLCIDYAVGRFGQKGLFLGLNEAF